MCNKKYHTIHFFFLNNVISILNLFCFLFIIFRFNEHPQSLIPITP
nr:MAG TPA_asm: hypothetical protein [Caudoviricetes sp.]